MDADGTTAGFDLEMIAAVRAVVDVPLIASGGAGRVEDFPPAVAAGADAVLAASVFHFGTLRIADVKQALVDRRPSRTAAGGRIRTGAVVVGDIVAWLPYATPAEAEPPARRDPRRCRVDCYRADGDDCARTRSARSSSTCCRT